MIKLNYSESNTQPQIHNQTLTYIRLTDETVQADNFNKRVNRNEITKYRGEDKLTMWTS